MDLFGFKRRRDERRRAAGRGAALEKFIDSGDRHRDAVARQVPQPPPRRRRPEVEATDGLYDSGLYPHSSAAGMMAASSQAGGERPSSEDCNDRFSPHSDSTPESTSSYGGDSSPSSGGWSDSSSSSGSGSTSSWSDSGSGYSSSASDSGSFSSSD